MVCKVCYIACVVAKPMAIFQSSKPQSIKPCDVLLSGYLTLDVATDKCISLLIIFADYRHLPAHQYVLS